FDLSSASQAQAVLGNIDKFIAHVDKTRGQLGAIQNRLESTISNQSNIAENESDARSRIRDTDYAEEAANLSQQTIIQQAATSMLTQANSRPQIALSLLG
ncbi:MAG: flagellin, partial [Succinivibrio sp.]|nr:flagellin [Succinivibrio sp.]